MRQQGIYGPYRHRQRWRLVVVDAGGKSTPVSYETREAAEDWKAKALEKHTAQDGVKVHQAIDRYEAWQKARRLKKSTYVTTRYRLTRFLAAVSSRALGEITPARAASIYAHWVTEAPV